MRLQWVCLLASGLFVSCIAAIDSQSPSPLDDPDDDVGEQGGSPPGNESPSGGSGPGPIVRGDATPGGSVMRRLNREAYAYTIRDLLGIESEVVRRFPDDQRAFGFSNNGSVQPASPATTALWYDASEEISRAMVSPNTEAYKRFVSCTPSGVDACARKIVGAFATAAWRRPATGQEVDDLLALYEKVQGTNGGADALAGLQAAFQGVLLSPHFIFLVEETGAEQGRGLSGRELAARLSYLLWSSVPDEELYAKADSNALTDPTVLRQQTERMLKDPRATRLVKALASEWLGLQRLRIHQPDPALFPEFTSELKADMVKETELTLAGWLEDNASVSALLTSDVSYINKRLAAHYGLPTAGDEFKRTNLGGNRRGILTQGSVLTVTSRVDGTSPVVRGVWVLEDLLCITPPQVPDNVPVIPEQDRSTKTAREALEVHSTDPVCAGCHKLFDPYGFALENFDAIGRWRTTDNGKPVDAKVEVDGTEVDGAIALANLLAGDETFHTCAARKLFAYANGRIPTAEDEDEIEQLLADGVPGLRDLITNVVLGSSFRNKITVKP